MQANNCMFKHPFDAKDRSRVRLRNMNQTESSDSVKKKKNRPIQLQKPPITSNGETLHDISLIFFSVDNKDTGLDVNACIHFWIKRCPELLWWFWFILQGSRIPSRPKNKAVRRRWHAWTATFRKKGKIRILKSLSVQTRPNEWALSTITVQALPLQLQFHRRTEKA